MMHTIRNAIFVSIFFFSAALSSILTVIDKRGEKTGVFVGALFSDAFKYRPLKPADTVMLDLGLDPISAVRWFEPEEQRLYEARINQPAVFLSGGVIEIDGKDGSYHYYQKSKGKADSKKDVAYVVQQWKNVEKTILTIVSEDKGKRAGIFAGIEQDNKLTYKAIGPQSKGVEIIVKKSAPIAYAQWYDQETQSFYRVAVNKGGLLTLSIGSNGQYRLSGSQGAISSGTGSTVKKWSSTQ